MINDVKVYGINESFKASKYPMATDTSSVTDEYTNTIGKLAGCQPGTGHDNFLNGILVQFDMTFTVKMSVEAERYHFFDFVSSQSTMHRIIKFDLDKSYISYVDKRAIKLMKRLVNDYNRKPTPEKYLTILYTNPCGFQLTARMTTNYRQLKTMYHQRKNHKLPEWKQFCNWIETLPYAKELIIGEEKK